MNLIGAGRTFLFAPEPHEKLHLWLVLTDPDGDPAEVIAVMVCTATDNTDPTVVLKQGDHTFIRHDSSVHYSTAAKFSVARIQRALERGHCHLKEDLNKELLARIRGGLLTSPFTVIAIKELCTARFRS